MVEAGNNPAGLQGEGVQYHKRDFWSAENLKYATPHFRLEKAAHILNKLSRGRHVDLLDVGCGPGTLAALLAPNISYYGIDIAIRSPAPNLLEADLIESPIKFGERRFGLIVAQGFFEYVGACQAQKFAEIRELLTDDGTFMASYVNFGHRHPEIYWPYSNVQPLPDFRESLSRSFAISRWFPTSHNWNHSEPSIRLLRMTQMPLNMRIPIISRVLGVEYFFLCGRK
jgi:SAM-dependent methyltransferase